jgi:hypothetical protein
MATRSASGSRSDSVPRPQESRPRHCDRFRLDRLAPGQGAVHDLVEKFVADGVVLEDGPENEWSEELGGDLAGVCWWVYLALGCGYVQGRVQAAGDRVEPPVQLCPGGRVPLGGLQEGGGQPLEVGQGELLGQPPQVSQQPSAQLIRC